MKVSDRISVRLIVIFVSITTLLVSLFGVFSYVSSKRAMEQQLDDQVRRAVSRLQIGLPAPIWNFDAKQLDTLLEAEMGDPSIAAIIVQNAKKAFAAGRVRDENGKMVTAKADSVLKGDKVAEEFKFDDSGQLKTVGTVEVYMSRDQIERALRAEVLSGHYPGAGAQCCSGGCLGGWPEHGADAFLEPYPLCLGNHFEWGCRPHTPSHGASGR